MKPSEWAERHRRIKEGQSAASGRWSNDYAPWITHILDAYVNEPEKEGWFWMKPAQIGGSDLVVSLIGYLIDCEPGPILYVCSTEAQAKRFSRERFQFMIDTTPQLRDVFDATQSDTLLKTFAGGNLALVGSGSESGVVSIPYQRVILDEYDLLRPFPTLGDAPSVARKRLAGFGELKRTYFIGFAHPTDPDRGIAAFIAVACDLREWAMPCPWCEEWIVPKWDQVHITNKDPRSAVWRCPSCSEAISDAQRWAATRRGKFISQHETEEAARRRYIGFHVSRMCHPRITLLSMAQEYCECQSESDLRVFFNMTMGEPYRDSGFVLTDDAVKERAEQAERSGRWSIPSTAWIVVIGVDVQAPEHDPTMYVRADSYLDDGNCYVIEFAKLKGWAAMSQYLAAFVATRPDGSKLRPRACGIDSGYLTSQVYSFALSRPGGIAVVPMKYDGTVRPADPVRRKQFRDPTRPELGRLLRLELCRGFWMDRQASRFGRAADETVGSTVVLPHSVAMSAPESEEFRNHITANSRSEIIDENGHPKLVWRKDRGRRDDYFQAGVYGEVMAVAAGLDQRRPTHGAAVHEGVSEVEEGLIRRRAQVSGRDARSKHGERHRRPRRGRTSFR